MFEMRTAFNQQPRREQPDIFVSEYAVTSGGGHGNLIVRAADHCLSDQITPPSNHISTHDMRILPYNRASPIHDTELSMVPFGPRLF